MGNCRDSQDLTVLFSFVFAEFQRKTVSAKLQCCKLSDIVTVVIHLSCYWTFLVIINNYLCTIFSLVLLILIYIATVFVSDTQ